MTPFPLLLILLFVVGIIFIVGLIRPGFVVFWREHKSRTSVLAVWGTATIVIAVVCVLFSGKMYFRQEHENHIQDSLGSGRTAKAL